MNKICFIGLGYIGLPTAALVASKGRDTIGVDINPDIVNIINSGKVHIIEPDLNKLVKSVVDQNKLKATLVPEVSDVYLIVVPTPFKENHMPDISYVEVATESIIPLLKEGDLYIIESTSPVGTTEMMADLIWRQRPELKGKIFIAYCPERVLPGNVIYELENNDRIIGGIDKPSAEKASEFYKLFVKGELYSTDTKTAEMCKLTENSSRDVQIAFANELSMVCEKAGINVWELISLANKHPRVNILQPGCGVGGHCIAVDPWFIISNYPEESQLIKKARDINDYKAEWCINKIIETAVSFKEKNGMFPVIACMGLAFKPDIDDLRESPAKYISSKIFEKLDSNVLIVEPNLVNHKQFKLENAQTAYDKADIIVWLVRHKEFLVISKKMNKIEIDFCGVRK